MGQRQQNIERALQLMSQRAGVIAASSSLYETPAWGETDQPEFLNSVCELTTALAPQQLRLTLRRIEDELGRDRSVKRWGPRVIDLDILLYDSITLDTPELHIPHPHMHERLFVLAPMVELSPELVHPVFRRSMSELLGDLR